MPVRCEAFCWGILSIRHWLIILQYMQCFKWSISFFFFVLRYCDQGICQLGAKLFAEESFLLGIDWSFYSTCNVSNDQLDFFFAQRYCDQGICQLGAKLFAEESFLLGIDWSFYSRRNVSNDQLVFFFALRYCDQGICQLGAKLFAEVSFLLSIDWSLTSSCIAQSIFFFLTICYFGQDYILCVYKFRFILKYCILSTSFLGRTKAMKMCLVFFFFD